MLRASLYIITCSARNRMVRRLRRLREPRYFIGAVAGVLYLYTTVFMRLRSARSTDGNRRRGAGAASSVFVGLNASAPALAGMLLLVAAGLSWVFPVSSHLLEFTPAETQFLFPAPVLRRQLLIHRLMRSQLGMLFGAVIMAVAYRGPSWGGRFRAAASIWILLATCHLYFILVTLARPRLSRAAHRVRAVAWAPLLLTVVAVALVALAVLQEASVSPVTTLREALVALSNASKHSVANLMLLPFVAPVRPLLVDSLQEFVAALPATALVYVMLLVWVIRSDEMFDRHGDDGAAAMTREPARAVSKYRTRQVGWTLGLRGRAEPVFVWKAALQTFRVVDRRVMVRLTLVLIWLALIIALVPGARGFAQMMGVFAAIGCGFTTLMVPQMLRIDLREDLRHLELLKTWPVRAAAVVRGEIAWPAMLVTAMAWVLGVVALSFSGAVFERAGLAWRLSIGLAALILIPGVVFAQYAIHNTLALLFPAWVPLGSSRPRGVDAMGQRLILLGGTWLLLAASCVPAGIVGFILWIAFYGLVGPWVLLPAALVALAIVAVEVLFATEAVGPTYERLDITSVERAE